MEAVQIFPTALLRHHAEPGSKKTSAQRQEHQTFLAQAETLCRTQTLHTLQVLPLGEIPVIQQPLAGGGHTRSIPVTALNRVVAAADLPQPLAQGTGGRLAAGLPRGTQQTRGRGSIIPQPLVFNVKGEILFHGDLLV